MSTDDDDHKNASESSAERYDNKRFNCRPYDAKNPFLAPVKVNRELHGPTSERSCMHIEFNIEGSKMRYEAGDHLAVYPVNNAELVNKLGAKCQVDLDTVITLTNTDGTANLVSAFWRCIMLSM